MKVEINESERFIKIKDLAKFNYFMLIVVFCLALIQLIFSFKKLKEEPLDWFALIWVFLGISYLILILYQTFKKSRSGKIWFDEIDSLTVKNIFGLKKFRLKLKNGKLRDLYDLQVPSEIIEFKKSFDKIGIRIIDKN